MRIDKRQADEMRPIRFTRQFTKHAEGSVFIEFGATKVLCTASVSTGVPRFLKDSKRGWLTAEYSMLPRATHDRTDREAIRGKQSGRTMEIQRLIGRSLRAAIDLTKLGEYTIHIDCDVIQADGGTRTASITGSYIALLDAVNHMLNHNLIKANPLQCQIASVSVGIINNHVLLDLNYHEDSNAETDLNIVMNNAGQFIELQGTAEKNSFSEQQLSQMLAMGQKGINELLELQTTT